MFDLTKDWKFMGSIFRHSDNKMPVLDEQVPQVMEVVGLGFTIWFTSRYLIFKVISHAPLEIPTPSNGSSSDISVCVCFLCRRTVMNLSPELAPSRSKY